MGVEQQPAHPTVPGAATCWIHNPILALQRFPLACFSKRLPQTELGCLGILAPIFILNSTFQPPDVTEAARRAARAAFRSAGDIDASLKGLQEGNFFLLPSDGFLISLIAHNWLFPNQRRQIPHFSFLPGSPLQI